MKSLSLSILGAALGLALTAGVAAAENTRIVYVTHGQASDPFWSVVKKGVDDAGERLGVTVEYNAPTTFDMVQMRQLIEAAIASKPDGLVVSIPDADALGPVIRDAVAAGIPVISIDSGKEVAKELGVLFHMGIDEYDAGFRAGERIKAAGFQKGLCVNHEVGNTALDQRCNGFSDAMDGSVEVLAANLDPTETRNRVAAFLQQNTDVDFILTVGAVAFDPTLEAVDSLDLADEVRIGSFDLSPTLLAAIRDGKADFAIDAQQYLFGYIPAVVLQLYATLGKMTPVSDIDTGPLFVTQDSAAQVIKLAEEGIR